jgi:hypothetical protein
MHKKKEQENNMYVSTYQRLKIKYPEITKLIFIPTSKPIKFRKCSHIKSQKQINTIKYPEN